MSEHLERLARFVAETSFEAIPPAVREHARLVLLDTLGVILVGSTEAEVTQLSGQLIRAGAQGRTG